MISPNTGWTTAQDLRQQVKKLWDKGVLLASMVTVEPLFPLRLAFKTPTSGELSDRYSQVRSWIQALQQEPGFRIEMKNIRHPLLGENTVPAHAWVDHFDDAINMIGQQKNVRRFADVITRTQQRHPSLIPWLQTQPHKALTLADDWSRLLDIVDWLQAHPQPAIYLRQVDIPGIDTKFIERHRGVLMNLMDLTLSGEAINRQYRGASQFEARYGFLQKPLRLRFRILDPSIQLIGAASQDISLTSECFRALDTDERFQGKIQRVFITENETNFLAFPDVKCGLTLFGQGYGFEALAEIPWLKRLPVYYWGDIDTHGFAILDQLRGKLPHAQSLLMDEATLLSHRAFWEQESTPETRDLERLSPAEQRLYTALRKNHFGDKVRLEQERVGFRHLLAKLGNN